MSIDLKSSTNSVTGFIFNGQYNLPASTGITEGFVYFKDANYIDSGYLPSGIGFDAIVPISGLSEKPSEVSGYIFYRINTPIYGVCHGFSNTSGVWYDGYNFYNAFHQEGSIAPPYGQNLTVVKSNEDGQDALAENGSCYPLSITEYNDLFGIVSKTDNGMSASTESIQSNAETFINSPAIACPQDLSVTYYWHEMQYKIIAGTAGAIAGNTFFNTNPIPCSLDNFMSKTASRYFEVVSGLNQFYDNGNGTKTEKKSHAIQFDAYGKPIAGFSTDNGTNIINTVTCPSILAESSLSVGVQNESQLLNAPDYLGQRSNSFFDFFNWWNIWHFLFKENSDGFPFKNDFNILGPNGANLGLAKTVNSASYGSQLFEATLSDQENYWERRQCPNAIDFLPHTFGASIYACPSFHFDVPYYAAIKKFGFYGTRFFNGCVSLQLEYPPSGNPSRIDSVEIPFTAPSGYVYITPEEGEPDNDKGIASSFSAYNNLLKVAATEELNSDFFALNKSLFLWANRNLIFNSAEYSQLSENYNFPPLFKNLFNEYDAVFPSGITGLLTSNILFESGAASYMYETGKQYSILNNNENYKYFKRELRKILNSYQSTYWDTIEKKYSNIILASDENADTGFYQLLGTSKENRFLTRYFENYTKGNPVDLYPSNKITFSFDKAGGLIDSPSWGKSPSSFGGGSRFNDTGLNRRYFVGAYGNGQDALGYAALTRSIATISGNSFYPGYFDSSALGDTPKTTYTPILTGIYASGDVGEPVSHSIPANGWKPLEQGWLAIGYNGIGSMRGDFSCFTPIFTKHPFPKTFCKIGQSPTMRVDAVDYHTIPEDKINIKNPEIVYWTKKLKIVNSKYENKYPLTYKWFRIKKSLCANNFNNFLTNPNFSLLEAASVTGTWCCLEGDDKICTFIRPKSCRPLYASANPAWSSKYANTQAYEEAKKNNFYMEFKQGAIKGQDDAYFYFCIVKGRFGMRIGEPTELYIDNKLMFDVAVQNGGNSSIDIGSVSFKHEKGTVVATASTAMNPYEGFVLDPSSIPEDIIEEKLPPPNAGWGDVYSYRFAGMWGYRGVSQSYTPGTLNDTRGLMETWGRFIHYGKLVKYEATLSQEDGNALYGTNHLPVCVNGEMPYNKKGIKVIIPNLIHWANEQQPIVSTNGNYGVKWSKLGNAGELYIPANSIQNGGSTTVSPGMGQWQWGNNLGTIHQFGSKSEKSSLIMSPYSLNDEDFAKLKTKLVDNGILAGENCGWNRYGLGRNMSYWIEGFSSFYIYCDNIKKKNISNYNYMNPGLRQTNSSIQYFWLGNPSNSYLERYPMPGPYAFQWRVKRHNRDRNGNGMSEGFYSYGWGTNYSLMYDMPAIYGLSVKQSESSRDIQGFNAARLEVFGAENVMNVRTSRFGFTRGNGGARNYGTYWIGNIEDENNNRKVVEYVRSGENHASYPEFNIYGCSDDNINNGTCFDPCLSIRYQNGFLPGGKRQDLTTAFPNGQGYKIVANNIAKSSTSYSTSTVTGADRVYFRGPFGVPHLKYMASKGININGFSPCFDGGADHCNYITPTINIGSSMYYESQGLSIFKNANTAAQSVNLDYPPK